MTDLGGKTVIITGASRGIGEAAAFEFVTAGANVVLLARGGEAIGRIAAEIGAQALAIPCDVADWGQVSGAVEQAVAHFGGADVLINNAGVIEPIASLAMSNPQDWGQVIDINLKGVYYGTRAVLGHMRKAGGGSILNISSGAAHNALEGWSHYCASKAGVHMLNMCLHKEEAGKGIRAIGLSPGTVATEMQREIKTSGVNPVAALDWSDHIPAEWVAKTLLWMCGPDADDFLGQEVSLREEGIRARVGLTE
ncbi:MAG: SDR family oxidoreductase [Rhodobacteraceae bacterium]|nr:SDR family oxidoreductase [Paracoccaceae bacterium]